jgi:anaerobic ribonucleoside-triphosphate reductase activating protein
MSVRKGSKGWSMPSLDVVVDRLSGALLVETSRGLPDAVWEQFALLIGKGTEISCAVPAAMQPAPARAAWETSPHAVRLAGYWYNSLIEGPGRRSVAKLQGCPVRCAGCSTPDSWDADQGTLVGADRLASILLDAPLPVDGVTVLGGEPMAQAEGLLELVRALRGRGCPHILVYSGFTYERLRRMARDRPTIGLVLNEIDVLIDGPYVQALAHAGGAWTGSGNQRVIDMAGIRQHGVHVSLHEPGREQA